MQHAAALPHPLQHRLLEAVASGDTGWLNKEGAAQVAAEPEAHALLAQLLAWLDQHDREADALALLSGLSAALPAPLLEVTEYYARILTLRGRIPEAIALLEILRRYRPKDANLHQQLAFRHQLLGDHAGAEALLKQALALDSGHAQARFALAQLRMMQSGFREGVAEYESRFSADPAQWLTLPFPRWQGESIAGKRLLLTSEQGVGDIIMFAGLLPALIAEQPAQLYLGVPPSLLALFQRSFPSVACIPQESHALSALPQACDFAAPMGDLIRYVLPRYRPAAHGAYLAAEPEMTAQARQVLKQTGAARFIGISWLTTNEKTAMARNIPLEQWEPIFRVPGCVFVSLQHGEGIAPYVDGLRQDMGFPLLVDPNFNPASDLDRLAAIVTAMDEVITAQNAVAHLAGALGKHTTLMLSAASDFRWGLRMDNAWYNSVTIERQTQLMEWSPVITRVAEGLKRRLPC